MIDIPYIMYSVFYVFRHYFLKNSVPKYNDSDSIWSHSWNLIIVFMSFFFKFFKIAWMLTGLHACMLTGLHACKLTGLHACMLTGLHACTLTGLHACILTGLHACTLTGLHACTLTGLHACILTGLHAWPYFIPAFHILVCVAISKPSQAVSVLYWSPLALLLVKTKIYICRISFTCVYRAWHFNCK